MPFKSKAQNAWAHTEAGEKALGGPDKVKEWESATDYSHLPKKVGKYAQGGVVDKGKRTHHQSHEQPNKPSIGGHNDGHGIFASGGPVRNEGNDRFYKTDTRGRDGKFLGTEDRFTGGRKPAGYPQEADTEENWAKPKGVGLTDVDDFGDCKTLKPVTPHASAGDHWYGKK